MKYSNLLKSLGLFVTVSIIISSCTALGLNPSQQTTTPNPNIVTTSSIISEGNLVPKEFRYLTFLRSGRVGEILVKKGDIVEAGQVIAKLGDSEQVNSNLAAAELDLLSVQQNYDELVRTSPFAQISNNQAVVDARSKLIAAERAWDQVDTKAYQDRIDEANIKKQDLKTTVDDAKIEFDKYKELSTDNPNYIKTKDILDKANTDYQEAIRKHDELILQQESLKSNLALAKANLENTLYTNSLTKDGPDSTKLALLEARLKSSKAQLETAKYAIETLEIKAPFKGEIIDINVLPNEQVGTTSWAFLLADLSEWFIETSDLTELKVVDLSVGDSAELSADALPDVKMVGTITEISKNFKTQSGDIIYKVSISVDDPDPLLRWGMTFQISFANKK